MIDGPAYSDAAEPVITKMPAPMIAPMPKVTRFTGPSARFRLCSPVSLDSSISMVIDFVANKGLPMQLLLLGTLSPLLGSRAFYSLTIQNRDQVKFSSHGSRSPAFAATKTSTPALLTAQ